MGEPGDARPVDLLHQGRERVICAWEAAPGLVVDPGPASCVDALLAGLRAEPRVLLLTHVHLDHAGATGVLCRRFPELRVYVHEHGAPHLVDPTRLLASAAKLYGPDMERLWGEVAAVPAGAVRSLGGGERVEGFDVAYTPGHASHHVCYLHRGTRVAYAGDVAGVRIGASEFTLAPTPPPDVDLAAWRSSLATVRGWRAAALRLTHFGQVDDVEDQLDRVEETLSRFGDRARDADREEWVTEVERAVGAALDPDAAASFLQAMPPGQCWLGLERYWRKRGERPTPAAAA